jgi:hypothetical protein
MPFDHLLHILHKFVLLSIEELFKKETFKVP